MFIYRILLRFFSVFLPDKAIINIKYKLVFHRKLNLKHPETFNEKLHWLRFYGYQELWRTLADKYAVREYVKEKIGEKYLIPLIQVYHDPAVIDFNELPSSFVFKLAHGSGWNIICTNKHKLNIEECIHQLSIWQKSDYYRLGREKQYKGIPPRILCEQFIGEQGEVPADYKFFCFNGQPHFIQVDISRFKNHRRIIRFLVSRSIHQNIFYDLQNINLPGQKTVHQIIFGQFPTSLVNYPDKLYPLLHWKNNTLWAIGSTLYHI